LGGFYDHRYGTIRNEYPGNSYDNGSQFCQGLGGPRYVIKSIPARLV